MGRDRSFLPLQKLILDLREVLTWLSCDSEIEHISPRGFLRWIPTQSARFPVICDVQTSQHSETFSPP